MCPVWTGCLPALSLIPGSSGRQKGPPPLSPKEADGAALAARLQGQQGWGSIPGAPQEMLGWLLKPHSCGSPAGS